MWVVKLGGSLNGDPRLPAWLEILAAHGGGRVVVVPGGGDFADAVRASQACWDYDEVAAHNMAVLAMVQTGLMLQALVRRRAPALAEALALARGEAEIQPLLRQGRVAIWLPFDLLRDQPDPPWTSWDASADSLALRLAGRLHAERLILVKRCAVPAAARLEALAAEGIVDRAFPGVARHAGCAIEVREVDALAELRQRLRAG